MGSDAAAVSTVREAARMTWEESKRVWGIGMPIAIAGLSIYAVGSVTTIFVGHLGNLPLAAASIGLSVFATFSLGFFLGMGSALETLCGQAFGAGQVSMLGVYLQRSWIILAVAALLMVPFYVFAEPILLAIGQDPAVAREAARFALYILPGALSFAVNFPTAKFLQSQSKVIVPVWICVGSLCFHVALSYLLVTVLGWGSPGAAVAYNLSLWAIALGQSAYIIGWCKDGWRGWSMAAFNDMWAFVRLSLESAVMICLEIWYLSTITVLTGNLQDAQIAVDSLGVCMNINGWENMIFIGINAAISVRVSNELGAGRPRAAMHAVIVIIAESLLIGLLCMALVLIFRDNFAIIYTTDLELQHAVSKIAGLLGLTMVLNSVQPVVSGFRGCCWRRMARPCCIHQPRLLLRSRIALGLSSRLQVQLWSWGDLGWYALRDCTSDTDFTLHSVENRLECRGCASFKPCAKVGWHRWNQASPGR
uniref:Protein DETOXIFICATION n=2 Tax=Aegilops tauschii subsp. strangulata TaxID=200361 RepID=A0A453QUY1_AEGTS